MRALLEIVLTITVILVNGCAILDEPKVTRTDDINKYKYVAISNTGSLSSGSGTVVGNQYGVYGGSTSKSVNPGLVIEGILLKKGFTSINEIRPEIVDKTLIVKYGESGKREVAGGLGRYTLEATISFINAKTYGNVYTCTAEGQGTTEADSIREAIARCLSGL